MVLVTSSGVRIPESELDMRFTASGGPGGQHANKAATRVELRWDVEASTAIDEGVRARLIERIGPVVRVVVDDERSQSRNRSIARDRLVERVDKAMRRQRRRTATKPTKGSQKRRVAAKKERGQVKKQRRRPSLDD
jgi:ribosome-associated protein